MAATVYATGAQMIERYDVRLLGDLVSDDDTRVASGSVAESARLVACLADASAQMDRALMAANRYTKAQLDAIKADGDASLIRLCCDLTLGLLFAARGTGPSDGHRRIIDDANDALDMILAGKHALNLDVARTAGLTSAQTPTLVDQGNMGRVTVSPFFPQVEREIVP